MSAHRRVSSWKGNEIAQLTLNSERLADWPVQQISDLFRLGTTKKGQTRLKSNIPHNFSECGKVSMNILYHHHEENGQTLTCRTQARQ